MGQIQRGSGGDGNGGIVIQDVVVGDDERTSGHGGVTGVAVQACQCPGTRSILRDRNRQGCAVGNRPGDGAISGTCEGESAGVGGSFHGECGAGEIERPGVRLERQIRASDRDEDISGEGVDSRDVLDAWRSSAAHREFKIVR